MAEPFRGVSDYVLFNYLTKCHAQFPESDYYARLISICNSSGTGKTRTILEVLHAIVAQSVKDRFFHSYATSTFLSCISTCDPGMIGKTILQGMIILQIFLSLPYDLLPMISTILASKSFAHCSRCLSSSLLSWARLQTI